MFGINNFYLNATSIVIWEVIFHDTESLRFPSAPSGSNYLLLETYS